VPGKVGQEDLYSQLSSNFGEMSENWHGVDVNVNARMRNGLTVQGGTEHGPPAQDNCDVRARCRDLQLGEHSGRADDAGHDVHGALANPYCRVVEPFLDSFRGWPPTSCRSSTCR
jgi:hypothetical protein